MFTSTIRVQSSTRASGSGATDMTPALFTRMSMLPNTSRAWAATSRTSSPTDTSQRSGRAVPPDRSISLANRARRSSLRAVTTTDAPTSASARAVDLPIPADAPVTMATFPSRRLPSVMGAPRSWRPGPSADGSETVATSGRGDNAGPYHRHRLRSLVRSTIRPILHGPLRSGPCRLESTSDSAELIGV